jgi:hypothetical protein
VIKGNLMQENQRQLRLFPDQSVTQGLQLNKLELKTQGDIEYQEARVGGWWGCDHLDNVEPEPV